MNVLFVLEPRNRSFGQIVGTNCSTVGQESRNWIGKRVSEVVELVGHMLATWKDGLSANLQFADASRPVYLKRSLPGRRFGS